MRGELGGRVADQRLVLDDVDALEVRGVGGEGVVRGEPVGHRRTQGAAVQPLLRGQRHDDRVPHDDDEVRRRGRAPAGTGS